MLNGALRNRMVIRRLSDIDQLHAGGELGQVFSWGQPVVEDDVCSTQRIACFKRQQPGASRPAAHQGDLAAARSRDFVDHQRMQMGGQLADPVTQGHRQPHVNDEPCRSDETQQASSIGRLWLYRIPYCADRLGSRGERGRGRQSDSGAAADETAQRLPSTEYVPEDHYFAAFGIKINLHRAHRPAGSVRY